MIIGLESIHAVDLFELMYEDFLKVPTAEVEMLNLNLEDVNHEVTLRSHTARLWTGPLPYAYVAQGGSPTIIGEPRADLMV